jgi:asparagine synthase (glutamine-hydrolysing)
VCGLLGILTADPQHRPDTALLRRCLEPLIQRGPDHQEVRCEPGLGLGHTRLAILDLGDQANQPIGEGVAGELVYNGEIYNFAALGQELGDTRYDGAGDTRVLHGYLRRHGVQADLNALDGMFAFAYYDRNEDGILLARDALGQKPLYYAQIDGDLWFASDAAPLRLALGYSRLNERVLSAWFAIGATDLATGETLFEGIRVLPPGHRLQVRRDDLKADGLPDPERWHDFTEQSSDSHQSIEALRAAVRARLVSEVPLGAMLSGGVDSALLVSLIAESRPLDGFNTFAVGYERDLGDLLWARRVASDLGVEHHELLLQREDYLNLLDDSVAALQAPLTFGNEPALLGLCRLAREKVTVVVGGEGADEAFGGYRTLFGAVSWRRRAQGFTEGLVDQVGREALHRSFGMLPPSGEADFFLNLYHWFHFAERNFLFRNEFKEKVAHDSSLFAHVDHLFDWAPKENDLERVQGVFLKGHLPRLLRRLDAMSMSCGLEARAPFCSRTLVDHGLGLPKADKLQPHFGEDLSLAQSLIGVEGKTVLRAEAKRHNLAVWNRPKSPFAAPFLAWFGPEHRDLWQPELFRAGGVERFIDPDQMKIWIDQNEGVNIAFKVWQLYSLGRFLDVHSI